MIRLAFLLVLLPSLASAQQVSCNHRDAVAAYLKESWDEDRQVLALDATGAAVEIFASPETGTWTLTLTRPGGLTCLLASGHAWEWVREPPPLPGDPA